MVYNAIQYKIVQTFESVVRIFQTKATVQLTECAVDYKQSLFPLMANQASERETCLPRGDVTRARGNFRARSSDPLALLSLRKIRNYTEWLLSLEF